MYVFAFDPLATEMRLMVDASRVLMLPEWAARASGGETADDLVHALFEHFERVHGSGWTDSPREAHAALSLAIVDARTTPEERAALDALDERLRREALGEHFNPHVHSRPPLAHLTRLRCCRPRPSTGRRPVRPWTGLVPVRPSRGRRPRRARSRTART